MIFSHQHTTCYRTGFRAIALLALTCLILCSGIQAQENQPADSAQAASDTVSAQLSTAITDEADSDIAPLPVSRELRTVPDSSVARLRASKEFAYANDPAYWKKEAPAPASKSWMDYLFDFLRSRYIRPILATLLVLVILYALYRIVVVNNLFLFYRQGKKKPIAEDTAFTEIDDDSLGQKIGQYESEGNFREATRYLYLHTLQQMNERGWIRYHSQATNYDYLLQLGTHPCSPDFAFLTRVYEYVWYGDFPIRADQYQQVKQHYSAIFQSGRR